MIRRAGSGELICGCRAFSGLDFSFINNLVFLVGRRYVVFVYGDRSWFGRRRRCFDGSLFF